MSKEAKVITLDYQGKTYTLEYTRKTVEDMERRGFSLNELNSKTMTNLPLLFAGAFRAHHRYVKSEVIEDILSHITKRDELFAKLSEMYVEPINALMSEPDENDEGNVSWDPSW